MIIVPNDNDWINALRNLYERKEINLKQFANCLRRIKDGTKG